MAILVTSKYEEDPIKIESARVATTLNINFSNTQRQITPGSEIRPRGYKTFFKLSSAEHEISTAHRC